MQYKLKLAGILVFIFTVFLSAARAVDNMQDLLIKCTQQPTGSSNQWYCLGRVNGVFEMMGLNGVSLT